MDSLRLLQLYYNTLQKPLNIIKIINMKITQYKKDGKTLYRFVAYIGINPVTGKQKQIRRSGFKTKREAENAYFSVKGEPIRSTQRFEDVYHSWFEQYSITVSSSTAHRVNVAFLNQILPVFSGYDIDKIKPIMIQSFINSMYSSYIKGHSFVSLLNSLFRYAFSLRVITENPMDYIVRPKRLKSDKKDNFYNKEELEEFLLVAKDKLSNMWYAFFRLLAYTGIRRGEALALTWEDIKEDSIVISKTLSRDSKGVYVSDTAKTLKSNRVIYVDVTTLEILNSIEKSSDFVFSNSKGSFITLSQPIRQLKKAIDGTDIKYISPHGFRHTHCSMLFSAGVPIPEVQKRLGHNDIKTTLDIYNHVYKEDEKKALNKFMEYLK